MRGLTVLCASACLASTCFASQPEDVYIHLGPEPTKAVKLAAEELEGHLKRILDRQTAVYEEGPGVAPAGYPLCVGDSAKAKALGVESAGLAPEQMRVRATADGAVMLGCDVGPTGYLLNGTRWAVYEFLEQLGVRWLWPGDLGTVIPRVERLRIPDMDIDCTPPIIQRKIRDLHSKARVQMGLDKMGMARSEYDEVMKSDHLWFGRHRLGEQGAFSYGHAFGHWWEEYGEDHPEWFAMQPDGTRNQGKAAERARLCVSNPEVIAKVAEEAIEKLAENPSLLCVSISPNDGGRATFCLCEECQALDPPEAELIKVWHPTDSEFTVRSLSDRYVRFYSKVAEIVAERFPDRYLGAYAYSAYRLPPLREKLHPNVFIGFVGYTYMSEQARAVDRASWDAWTEKAERFFLRPNLLGSGIGYPSLYPHRLIDDMKHCYDTGMRVTDFDCCYHHWALQGLNYYVLARFLWNPGIDVDAVIDDYCKAGWGPAAGNVRQYFDRLEGITDRVAAEEKYTGRRGDARVLASYYPDEVLAELQGLLDEAKQMAVADEGILGRIAFLQTGLEWTRLVRDKRMAYGSLRAQEGSREDYQAADRALLDWCLATGPTQAVNTPWMKFLGF